MFKAFNARHGAKLFYIHRASACRIIHGDHVSESCQIPNLQRSTGVSISISVEGQVSIWGNLQLLDAAQARIVDIGSRLEHEKRATVELPMDYASYFQQALPDLIMSCDGPSDPRDQALLVTP